MRPVYGMALCLAALLSQGPARAQVVLRPAMPAVGVIPGMSLLGSAPLLSPDPGMGRLDLGSGLLPSAPALGLPAVAAPSVSPKAAGSRPAASRLPTHARGEDWNRYARAPLWSPSDVSAGSSDLSAWMRPPGSQGNERNTCSVFAASSLGEYLLRTVKGEDLKISEQYLYYIAKRDFIDSPELEVYKTIDGLGGFVAVEALNGGVLESRHWPYEPSLQAPAAKKGPEAAVGFKDGEPFVSGLERLSLPKRDEFERFTGRPPAGAGRRARTDLRFDPVAMERGHIKQFLAQERRPVVFNIMVYFDAIDPATGRFRRPSDDERRRCRESGAGCGGHVILITGYDAAAQEFIFRNSWGASWGAGGYGRLPEAYVLDDCEMCGHLAQLPTLDEGSRKMVVNGSYGWSAGLR
ncbi:MAG: hypothetical protein A2X36_08315 [Elusimicrobia bacterium GWA2_69_24]|nr:MAG: hypothetical protein A2X36_08315 [Elusimicrobia bacterium GWA2_69_24]